MPAAAERGTIPLSYKDIESSYDLTFRYILMSFVYG